MHENIGSCEDKRNNNVKMTLYFTINQAAYLYFPELVPDLNLKFDVILEKPRKKNLAKVQLITAEDKNVVQHKQRPMMLPSAMKSIRQNQTISIVKVTKPWQLMMSQSGSHGRTSLFVLFSLDPYWPL